MCMCVCVCFNWNFVETVQILTEPPNFASMLLERSQRSVSHFPLLYRPHQIPPCVLKWFYRLNVKFRETQLAKFNFLENLISLSALIQVSRPQTYDKGTCRCVTHWHFLLNALRPQKCQSFGFHSETPSCKTPTNLTVDGCSAQAPAFECLNGPHTLLLFSLVRSFTTKWIYLKEACSGSDPESPIHFRTWTWKAGNMWPSYFRRGVE